MLTWKKFVLSPILVMATVCAASASFAANVTLSGSGTYIDSGVSAASGSLAHLGGTAIGVNFATGTLAGDAAGVQSPSGSSAASSVVFQFDGADLGFSYLAGSTPAQHGRSIPNVGVSLDAGEPVSGVPDLVADGTYDLLSIHSFTPDTVFTAEAGTIAGEHDFSSGAFAELILVHEEGFFSDTPLGTGSALPASSLWLDSLVVAVLHSKEVSGGTSGEAFAIIDPVSLSLGASQIPAPVPLPAGLPLLLSALAPMLAFGVRRHRTQP